MTVFDLRGTHGSGKSWFVHRLIADDKPQSILRDGELIGTFLPRWGTAVLGNYIFNCGGCDTIKYPDEVCRRVRDFAAMEGVRHVILEGILVAHTYQRYADLAAELDDYVFCFLNVSLDVCIARVEARRAARGWVPEFDLYHITHDWRRIHQRLPKKFTDAGCTVVWLNGDAADISQLTTLLEAS